MRKTKYIASGGLAFSEEEDMKKLSSLSEEGWIAKKLAPFGYVCKRGESKSLQYAVDYRKDADDEYFAYFEEAGWTHVSTAVNYIHLFSAPEGTTPIYTDKPSTIEKYEAEKRVMGRAALPTLLITIALFMLYPLSDLNWMADIFGEVGIVLGYVSMIVLVFTGMPYLGFRRKVHKLRKS
ncbi:MULTISPECIES: DUF2812 domain-containing protein [Pontibacillus]|uniref:DUF2812 domain-containing protein n=1 Tax=Pontibacillus chungwhensis TaxID=265426 RepID=A0ABY8UT11_9BACI|nr:MULTISPECIES: DUF2812 domain-containing protein [Pontibacillus]MCD5323430.1 DUF2812 domain-containing protein [Pontibacillus sp. HN14]WIF96810.1 DUF2812 domain-containing protein [Pontibacillus chungwhensis]